MPLRYIQLLVFICIAASGTAQTSIALEPVFPDPLGPFFLNDSVLIYGSKGSLYAVSTAPEATPKGIGIASVQRLVQREDGTIYALPGFSSDIAPRLDRIFTVTGTSVASATLVVAAPIPASFANQSIFSANFDVSPDGIAWLLTGQRIATLNLATGDFRQADVNALLPEVGYFSELQSRLVALDSVSAFFKDANRFYFIDQQGARVRLLHDSERGAIRRRGNEVLIFANEYLHRYDASGQLLERIASPVPNPTSVAFSSDNRLLFCHFPGQLSRWSLDNLSVQQMDYYPAELKWAILTAQESSTGNLLLSGASMFDIVTTPEVPPVVEQNFIQYLPAGIKPTLLGPPLDFDVAISTTLLTTGQSVAQYKIRVRNQTDEIVRSALIRSPERFGVPTNDLFNGGYVDNLAPGDSVLARNTTDAFYKEDGRPVGVGRSIFTRFAQVHSNGRPVLSSDVLINERVVSIRDIIVAADVRLYPTLATAVVNVAWQSPRTELLVLDGVGRVAFRQNLLGQTSSTTLDVSAYPAGTYRVLLRSTLGTSVHTFVIP